MPVKKTELYSSLWASCDELRGGMDASQYKDYVLVLLFVKYVSDKYAGQPYASIVIPEGGSFADMVALKGDKDIGDKINKIIGALAEANELKGVIDVADFNDPDKLGQGKDMVDKLSNLVAIFEEPGLDFSNNRMEGDDIMGDAYEYLMRNFATQSGKSKGQFYTPAEVSRVMAKVIGISEAQSQSQTIYDPTCGSGSLLLKAADEATSGVTIYGQELDNATSALARMNMILHDNPTAEIWQDNSLARPHWVDGPRVKAFDYVVANPPFSYKAWRNGFDPENDQYGRFEYGIPPNRNGDYAFLLHIISSLKSTGRAAVILPHGVLFRGNVEGDIRRELVQRGFIEGIIGLPPNLFFGTGIPACIIILDKKGTVSREDIFMIDASAGFIKDGNKNRLRHQDIRKIVDIYTERFEQDRYSRLVSKEEIEENEYNLNMPRYIDTTEPEDLQDIEAHLKGGIPNRDIANLERYWKVFPSLKEDLFEEDTRPGYSMLRIEDGEIKSFIMWHSEYSDYSKFVFDLFDGWKERHRTRLIGLGEGDSLKSLIAEIGEDYLETFTSLDLIDKYDLYQHLLTYWAETTQDDLYLILQEGWEGANKLRLLNADSKESPDLKIGKLKYKVDLIPPDLIIATYFSGEKQVIEELEADLSELEGKQEELEEEYGGEEGLLEESKSDAGNVTKGAAKARLKDIQDEPEFTDEIDVIQSYLDICNLEANVKQRISETQKTLDKQILQKYQDLQKEEIIELVVDQKWLSFLQDSVEIELDSVTRLLTNRITDLSGRYEIPLPEIVEQNEKLSAKVESHLKRMGYSWK